MYNDRLEKYRQLEGIRNSKILVYVTGDRPGLEAQISPEVLDYFTKHLDFFSKTEKISLYLYTRGGDTLAAWSLVNLIRQFCHNFEVIIPSKAHSSGTLISIGANQIVMTKQATLGPIDPSVNTPLNPSIPNGNPSAKLPVSVEAINGFLELAKHELNIHNENDLTSVLIKLADMVHPLVLGQVYRAKTQIQMLAKKLLLKQMSDEEQIQKIISFLVSDSGSHDYTIYRDEAKDSLGLNIVKPTEDEYTIIKGIYEDIVNDLELNKSLSIDEYLGGQNSYDYSFKRGLIESVEGGSDTFVTEGTFIRQQIQAPQGIQQAGIQDIRKFEGWKHV